MAGNAITGGCKIAALFNEGLAHGRGLRGVRSVEVAHSRADQRGAQAGDDRPPSTELHGHRLRYYRVPEHGADAATGGGAPDEIIRIDVDGRKAVRCC